jgi:GDPmannose 4,6-dehydratase
VKTALITGITGQDGYYLARYLLSLDYHVVGLLRGQENPKRSRVEADLPGVRIVEGDLFEQGSLISILETVKPDEVYNLGAISFVPISWRQPELTSQVTGLGVLRMLEAIRIVNPHIRFYQASSSEMFGKVRESPQTERTPFHPRSPYGVAKVFGHHITVNYRESYGLYACSGILFNHESPRRGLQFVTRKITAGVAAIVAGRQQAVVLGNLEARRDWGFAGDYVRAMHLMLQQREPDDYVIATGETHSVGEFCERAFAAAGLDWRRHVQTDASLLRPAEVDLLIGDASKARRQLGWTPEVGFDALVKLMVDHDVALLNNMRAVSGLAHE